MPAEKSAAPTETPSTDPFAFADFTWLNGNSRQTEFPMDSKFFTGEFRLDTNYIYDFANPIDHTLVGSTNAGRTQEVQVEQLGVGGDFNYNNVRGRRFTQFGMYRTTTPRNDASPLAAQWDLGRLSLYFRGVRLLITWMFGTASTSMPASSCPISDFGVITISITGSTRPSYVSSNTPWFFNGIRIQIFPSDKLKIEPWLINGWQSYGMFNEAPGVGPQILWRPNGSFSLVSNNYIGHDTLLNAPRLRVHSDNSVQVKYLDAPKNVLSKAAFSVTADAGCENGGGVTCDGSSAPPSTSWASWSTTASGSSTTSSV